MIAEFLLWSGVSLLLYAFYKWGTIHNDYFKKRGVSFIKPTFLIGSNAGFFMFRKQDMIEFMDDVYRANPGFKILGTFEFRTPALVVRDPDIIKQVAIKDFEHFEDHRNIINDNVDVLFANSLFFLTGSKWRDMRATLSPAFTGSKMRQMFELVSDCGNEMAQTLLKRAKDSGEVDCEMKDLFSKYTTDVISSTAFGLKIKPNSFEDPSNEFYTSGKKITDTSSVKTVLKLMVMILMPKVAKLFGFQIVNPKITNFFRSMVLDNIESRDKHGIFRPDMINILMNVKKGNSLSNVTEEHIIDGYATVEESNVGKNVVKRMWTDDELVAQSFLFFFAGFDTSSTLLSFLIYELSINSDIQQKLYEEVEETHKNLNGNKLTYDTVMKLKYLDMVISETLRLWPPAPGTDRICVKDYDYDDGQCKFKIEKGTVLTIPIVGLHRDEKYWANPKKFNPERFSDVNKDTITPGTYLAFGLGPRNCIGSRFALMETKAVIYYLLLSFKFEPNEKSQIPIKLKKGPLGMATEKGVHVAMKLRK